MWVSDFCYITHSWSLFSARLSRHMMQVIHFISTIATLKLRTDEFCGHMSDRSFTWNGSFHLALKVLQASHARRHTKVSTPIFQWVLSCDVLQVIRDGFILRSVMRPACDCAIRFNEQIVWWDLSTVRDREIFYFLFCCPRSQASKFQFSTGELGPSLRGLLPAGWRCWWQEVTLDNVG